METLVQWLREAPWWQVVLALLAENLLILVVTLALGQTLVKRYRQRRVALPPLPLARLEVAVTVSTVILNTVVTIVGCWLWRADIIQFRTDVGACAWLDVLALLLIMDLAMYFLHRLAHHPLLFPLMHRLHHVYDRPRPLTLFILNPVENLSFGVLWLVVIFIYPASWLGMSIYLVLNVLFGMMGHLGVEPFPEWWGRVPVVRLIAGSTFHARHHQDLTSNYGFYTLIWDSLFGTLGPDYWTHFGDLPARISATAEQTPLYEKA